MISKAEALRRSAVQRPVNAMVAIDRRNTPVERRGAYGKARRKARKIAVSQAGRAGECYTCYTCTRIGNPGFSLRLPQAAYQALLPVASSQALSAASGSAPSVPGTISRSFPAGETMKVGS